MIILTIIIFTAIFIIIKTILFKNTYTNNAREGMGRISRLDRNILLEKDLSGLPAPVQKYLRYAGVINREKVLSARIVFNGFLQEVNKPPLKIRAEQTSFFDIPTRLFIISSRMMGIPITALHKYTNAQATFEVKPLSLFHIVNEKGGNLNIAETVTFFNDMCLLAPSTLIDSRVKWEEINDHSVKGRLTIDKITVSATLIFNDTGQLISFSSDDRYYRSPEGKMEKVRWTTPVRDYRNYSGFMLASYGEAIWSLPEGDFCYAKFNLEDVVYNVKE